MSSILIRYFSPERRVVKTTWWAISFVAAVVVVGLTALMFLAVLQFFAAAVFGAPYYDFGSWLIAGVIFTVFSLMFSVKRILDQERSFRLLLIYLVPVFGPFIMLVTLGFVPGSKGDNECGTSSSWSDARRWFAKSLLSVLMASTCSAAATVNAVIAMGGDSFPLFPWIGTTLAVVSWGCFTWLLWQRPYIDAMAHLTLRILTFAAFSVPASSASMVLLTRGVQDPIFPPWFWAIVFSILGIVVGLILRCATHGSEPPREVGPP